MLTVSKQPPDDHAEKVVPPVVAAGFTEDALVKDVDDDSPEGPLELEQDAFPIAEINRSGIFDFPKNDIGVNLSQGIKCTFRGVGAETGIKFQVFKVQAVSRQPAPKCEPVEHPKIDIYPEIIRFISG